ncbi:MAG: DUF1553 domain-containing protein [Planctomycetota bacterium]|jgi:hypothetical protein
MLSPLLSLTLLLGGVGTPAAPFDDALYRDSIAPLFEARCGKCHNPETSRGDLDLSRPGAVAAGGARGSLLGEGAETWEAALLWRAVSYEEVELRMPPRGKLPEGELALIEHWLKAGAPLPEDADFEAHAGGAAEAFNAEQRAREHWSWQKLSPQHPPVVRDEAWLRDPLDRFVLADLEAAGLTPTPPLERAALIRRLSVDLVGLLPTPEEVAAFEADDAPDALERLVDRLLGSPAFAERWGRHWLDLMRYAETRGHEFDYPIANAWRYRDYVLSALDQDVPYDRFLSEHVAGDLLPQPRPHPIEGWNESPLGTAFWGLGEEVHSPVDIRGDELERLDDKIDVFGKAFLGLTISCARCHDHKFDAISTRDYYALEGYLTSSRTHLLRFQTDEREQRVADWIESLRGEAAEALDSALLPPAPEASAPAPDARLIHDWGNAARVIQDGWSFTRRDAGALELDLEAGTGERLPFAAAVYEPAFDGLSLVDHERESSGRDWDPAGRTLHSPSFEPESGEVHLLVRGAFDLFISIDSHRLVHGPLHQLTTQRHRRAKTEEGLGPDLGWRWISLNLGEYLGERVHLELTPRRESRFAAARLVEGPRPEDPQVESQADWPAELDAALAKFAERYAELRSLAELASPLAPALLDANGFDQRVYTRGNPRTPGGDAPRRMLEVLHGDAHTYADRSGRLELARELTDPEHNPFVPRVAVNRVWHHLFGRGIVPSPDDFGVLGEAPTHPELLDYLAWEFVADGWSTKRLIRRIVLSSTYLQGSAPRPSAMERDPDHLLLWRHTPRRLDAEALRDGLLVLSGRLNPEFGGPSVPVHLTAFLQGRGRPGQSGPLDGDGRRSLYISVRRNFLDPFFSAFDFPSPSTAIGRRSVSNVPAQALALLNSPLVNDLCRGTAERLLAEQGDDASRLERLYRQTLARSPSPAEAERCLEYVAGIDGDELDRWSDLAHVLVNTKEFLFVQ